MRHTSSHAQRHGRLIRALRPYRDDSTSVGDAVRRAAAELGVEAGGCGAAALAWGWWWRRRGVK